tara:strand:+ start:761 stop:988 length:228 start_codon:yes stop_codon:yes gene_type:complete
MIILDEQEKENLRDDIKVLYKIDALIGKTSVVLEQLTSRSVDDHFTELLYDVHCQLRQEIETTQWMLKQEAQNGE